MIDSPLFLLERPPSGGFFVAMPKSKKPRKKFVSGQHAIAIRGVSPSIINNIRTEIANAEVALRIKLPRGEATYSDLDQVRSLFNCLMFCLEHRQKVINFAEAEAAANELLQAGIDLGNVMERGAESGRFVCRASEMTSILAGMQTADDFFFASLKTCPVIFVDEFNASLLIKEALPEHGEINIQNSTLNLAYRLAQKMAKVLPHQQGLWKKQAIAEMKNHLNALSKGQEEEK